MKPIIALLAAGSALAFLPGCMHSDPSRPEAGIEAGEEEDVDAITAAVMGVSYLQGAKLQAAIAEADKHPLGSQRNPVRVSGARGEHIYLGRLKCSSGDTPAFYRMGSVGVSPFGNIADLYSVTCEGAEPVLTQVYMDMYHPGHIEDRPVAGFAITPSDSTAVPT